jgi:diguanylate cyclase (GGDEF)-like protein
MNDAELKNALKEHIMFFGKNLCESLEAMTSICATTDVASYNNSYLHPQNSFVVLIPFSGTIQGNYVLSLSERIATDLLMQENISLTYDETNKYRDASEEFFKEVLNTAAGASLFELEKSFGTLTMASPIIIHGEVIFPQMLTGNLTILAGQNTITCSVGLNLMDQKIARKLKEKTHEAMTDALTGLHNRAAFEKLMLMAIEDSQLKGSSLGLIMVDIDHFKRFNDTFGHLYGDSVIKLVASVLRNTCRESDVTARYGGDEFLMILPGCKAEGAKKVAQKAVENMKKAHEDLPTPAGGAKPPEITISIGVASLEGCDNVQKSIDRVDALLYRAKQLGRNRIVSSLDTGS